MLFDNHYNTIKSNARAEFKDRGSSFFGYAFKIKTKAEFDNWLKKVKQKYPDATHHCWAYMLHPDKSESHSSDDGEPANSAGKPILRAIQSKELTQIGIVVVRYYGGVNLGIPGLINAYGNAANYAIEKATITHCDILEYYEVKAQFGNEKQWFALINNPLVNVITQKAVNDGYEAFISSKKAENEQMQTLISSLFLLEIKFMYFG